MQPDVHLLLTLLRLRLLQASGATVKAADLKKWPKVDVSAFLGEVEVETVDKKGKAKKKKTKVVMLNADGERLLRESADQMAQGLNAKSIVQDFQRRIQNEVAAALAKVNEGFTGLASKLGDISASVKPSAIPAGGQTLSSPDSIRDTLHRSYKKLCQFVEFEDGLVDIPRLYHEARKEQPALTVAALHRELESLWSKREIELKILNEVRSASEPDKGIRRDDNLYYYVIWRSP